MKVIILILASLVLIYGDDVDILCSESFCTEYLEDNTCPDLPQRCQIQNETHSGIDLPFAGPCQCCDYCIANLDEGEHCALGDAVSPVPTVVCGDLLFCTFEDDDSTCQELVSACTEKQREFDNKKANGTLGHLELRENCDRRGLYETYKCIPGEICYCVSEEGERIFGEIPHTILALIIMNCECSRQYEKASAYMGRTLNRVEHLRCQSNGDYDPIQCVDDEDCFCVHREDGSMAINDGTVVNSTSITNETLTCFDTKLHVEGEYYRECELQVMEIMAQIEEYEEMGYEIIGYSLPNCQLDGYYAPVQQNKTIKYCSDPEGNILEDFFIDVNDTLVDSMNCKCARSRSISQLDKPQCCRNGNYNPMQCRRGLCRCVDENGNQNVKEVPFASRDTLECYQQTGCVDDGPKESEDEEEEEEEIVAFASRRILECRQETGCVGDSDPSTDTEDDDDDEETELTVEEEKLETDEEELEEEEEEEEEEEVEEELYIEEEEEEEESVEEESVEEELEEEEESDELGEEEEEEEEGGGEGEG